MTNERTGEGDVPRLPPYRLTQAGANINIPVPDFEGLVTHHPGDNRGAHLANGVVVGGQVDRSQALVGGEVQEIEARTPGNSFGLAPDQVLLKKDFILEDSRISQGRPGARHVDVPSPLTGYIGFRDDARGRIDILDREGGEVIARVRHMRPIGVNVGDTVQYGQSLGTQSDQATERIHVHMEVDTRYYQHYENYVADLVSGRLSIDPDRRTAGIEARPVIDDGVIRIGESAGIVRTVQQRLNEEGFLGADHRPLQVDGVYRLSMQAAVINYQQARGLPQTGDIDPVTLQEIAPRIYPPAVNDAHRPNGNDPPLPPYMDRYGSVPSADPGSRTVDDPLVPQAERAVRQLEQSLGRPYTDQSACMAASVACVARANGLSRIDHVLLSEERGGVAQGESLFVVQGNPGDPAHHRVMTKTQEAISTPVEQSMVQLQALNEAQRREPLAQTMDGPVREPGPQMRMM